jgi:hypothetical protein
VLAEDLLDAHAPVEWAKTQFPILQVRIDSWLATEPYTTVVESDVAETGYVLVKAKCRVPLPRIISADLGAIINSIRTSLDLLANVLVVRNGQVPHKRVWLPICETYDKFLKRMDTDLDQLSITDRRRIVDLRPYGGAAGDSLLYALHQLDITRKHRQLIALRRQATNIGFGEWRCAKAPDFRYTGMDLADGTVLARVPADAYHGIYLMPGITFEGDYSVSGMPVVTALERLAWRVEGILHQFSSLTPTAIVT